MKFFHRLLHFLETEGIVHDPMYYLGETIFRICCFENTKNDGAEEWMANWFIKTKIQHPQQPDIVSCGVFSIISSMRAMVLIKQSCAETGTFPSKSNNIVRYRRSFAKILLDDDKGVELDKFVKMFS
jgi:hypothetical protein